MPLYRQAQAACFHKQYKKAAELLNKLSTTANLTPDQIAFCNRQRDICLSHLSSPSNHNLTPVSTADTARPNIGKSSSPADADCGPRALLLICRKLGIKTDLETLRKVAGTTASGTTMEGMSKVAKSVGFNPEGVQLSREALSKVDSPSISWIDRKHYIACLEFIGEGEKRTVVIHDPNKPESETIPLEKLLQMSSGYMLLLKK